MLSVNEVHERIQERISPLEALEIPVAEAHGCVLAQAVTAPEDVPPHPSAATDGFALRSGDTEGAASSPVSMTIVGEAVSGRPFAGKLASREAVRISTGVVLPEGADAVVLADNVAVVGSSMALGASVPSGAFVRPAGQDIAKGAPIMKDGQRIRGMDVGVLAALGHVRVAVRPRPRVVIVSVGDELSEPGVEPTPGFVRDADSASVASMCRESGAEPSRAGIAGDDEAAIKAKLESFESTADAFVICGGVKTAAPVVSALGSIDVWDLSVVPPMKVGFGTIGDRPLFALPGDPVATVLAFELFVRPAMLRMAGRTTTVRQEVEATADDAFECDPQRGAYLRVRAWRDEHGWRARLAGADQSSLVSSVAGANAIAVIEAGRGRVVPGDIVRLRLLEPLEGW